MSRLALQRCVNHVEREAAVRCPSCGRYFCRECVTEHKGRFMCSGCLSAARAPTVSRGSGLGALAAAAVQALCALGCTWGVFYTVGRLLLLIPSSFHDGTAWERLVR